MQTTGKKTGLVIWCIIMALLLVLNVFITSYALSWDKVLTGYFGTVGGGTGSAATIETQQYTNLDDLRAAEKEAELLIVSEGAVLLKNDSAALPLAAGSKVSVFGQTAQMWMTKEKIKKSSGTSA